MDIIVKLEIPKKLFDQLEQEVHEQPWVDSVEELALCILGDAMEEKNEEPQSHFADASNQPKDLNSTSFSHLIFPG